MRGWTEDTHTNDATPNINRLSANLEDTSFVPLVADPAHKAKRQESAALLQTGWKAALPLKQ